jgi:hypothetical protein
MSGPTVGITILIILMGATFGQLLLQGSEHRKRYRELHERFDRLEEKLREHRV